MRNEGPKVMSAKLKSIQRFAREFSCHIANVEKLRRSLNSVDYMRSMTAVYMAKCIIKCNLEVLKCSPQHCRIWASLR